MKTIAIADPVTPKKVLIWAYDCAPTESDGTRHLHIINGDFDITLKDDIATFPILNGSTVGSTATVEVVWEGYCPFKESEYCQAIQWIETWLI